MKVSRLIKSVAISSIFAISNTVTAEPRPVKYAGLYEVTYVNCISTFEGEKLRMAGRFDTSTGDYWMQEIEPLPLSQMKNREGTPIPCTTKAWMKEAWMTKGKLTTLFIPRLLIGDDLYSALLILKWSEGDHKWKMQDVSLDTVYPKVETRNKKTGKQENGVFL